MFELIKRLFCRHEFEDVSGLVKVWSSDYSAKFPIGYERTFVCKKCLKKKTIKF